MITEQAKIDQFYDMLVKKDSNYEGVFYVGVKTTGYSVAQPAPRKSQTRKIASFSKQLKKHFWPPIDHANDANR